MGLAIILTTQRVVEIVLIQRQGKMLPEMNNVQMAVKSYFPEKVTSGFIRCADGFIIQSSITSDRGQLVVQLPSTQLSFAQKMQLVTSRLVYLPTVSCTIRIVGYVKVSVPTYCIVYN